MGDLTELAGALSGAESREDVEEAWESMGYEVRRGGQSQNAAQSNYPVERETTYALADEDGTVHISVEEIVSFEEVDPEEIDEVPDELSTAHEEDVSEIQGVYLEPGADRGI